MNLEVGCAELARGIHVGRGNKLSILLHFARNDKERFQLGTDVGLREIGLDLLDERFVTAEMSRGDGAMNAGAKEGAVAARDIGGDEFAFAFGEGAGSGEKYLDDLVERLCGLRAKRHGAADTDVFGRKRNVRHGGLRVSEIGCQWIRGARDSGVVARRTRQ